MRGGSYLQPFSFTIVLLLIWLFLNDLGTRADSNKAGIQEFSVKALSKHDQPVQLFIKTNSTSKSLSIDYRTEDGNYYSWVAFYSLGFQLFKAIILGEIDRGEPQHHYLCFIHSFRNTDIIPFDILQKLTQAAPSVLQKASSEEPLESIFVEHQIKSIRLNAFGRAISDECSQASSLYSTSEGARNFASDGQIAGSPFVSMAHLRAINDSIYPFCGDAAPLWELGCICRVEFCIDWYPCGVKMCPRTSLGNVEDQFICGIKSCKKCRSIQFHVDQRKWCFWSYSD